MPDLETLLRERLGALEDPKDHPDPDTLTAFVEELLPAAERNGVYMHISLCKQCRDVVALTLPERALPAAAPEEEPVAVAALPAPRRWWFLTPQFGLAASLVAVAAGVFLVLEIPRMRNQAGPVQTAVIVPRQETPAPVATLQSNDSASTMAEGKAQPDLRANAAPPSAAGREQDLRIVASAAVAERKNSLPSRNQPSAAGGPRARDFINNQVLANQMFPADLVVIPAQPQELPSAPRPAQPTFTFPSVSLSQNGSATLSTAFLAPPSAAGTSQGTITVYPLTRSDRQSTGFLSKLSVAGRQLHLKRQIPAISAENATAYAMFSPGLAKAENSEITAKPAEPAATTELGQSAAFTGSGLRGRPSALDMGANSFLWRVAQGKLLKSSDMEHWIDGYPATEGIEFSVVTASGAEVWAGGKDAALVHSKDGGLTWERITLGASATGNIRAVEVNHSTIRVTSSSGQGWLSKDGGRSWTLQD